MAAVNSLPPSLNPSFGGGLSALEKERADGKLVRALEKTAAGGKGRVDNAKPRSMEFGHVKHNAKKKLAERMKMEEVEKGNARLLARLTEIAKGKKANQGAVDERFVDDDGEDDYQFAPATPPPPAAGKTRARTSPSPAASPAPSATGSVRSNVSSRPSSASKQFRKQQAEMKIMAENQALLRRLENCRGSLKTYEWDRDAEKHAYLRELRSNRPRSARRTPVRVADDEQPGFEF